MEQLEAPEAKQSSRWAVGVSCSLLVILVVAGSLFAMRDQLLLGAREQARKEESERAKLAARIESLQTSLDSVSGAPKPDAEALQALTTQLGELSTKLDTMNARLTALENKPETKVIVEQAPAPLAAAPATPAPMAADAVSLKLAASSGKPFASELAAWVKTHPESVKVLMPLSAVAESGIPSESELNRKLREALDDATRTKKIDDTSMVGKINTHLSGLVSIKKTATDGPYAKLRNDVLRDDSDMLIQSVEGLSEEDRKPLEGWLASAKARRDALNALATIDSGTGR